MTGKGEHLRLWFKIFLNGKLSSWRFVRPKLCCNLADVERNKFSCRYPLYFMRYWNKYYFHSVRITTGANFMKPNSLTRKTDCRVLQQSKRTIILNWTVNVLHDLANTAECKSCGKSDRTEPFHHRYVLAQERLKTSTAICKLSVVLPSGVLSTTDGASQTLPRRWSGREHPIPWPPRSCDLIPLDIFLSSHKTIFVASALTTSHSHTYGSIKQAKEGITI